MSDRDRLERRLRTVERTLTGEDHDLEAVRDRGELVDRVETLEERLADAEERVDELEAANQALRGYVGNVRSVNEDVEQRAEAALAAVDRLADRLDDRDPSRSTDDFERSQPGAEPSAPADRRPSATDPQSTGAAPDRSSASTTDRFDREADDASGADGETVDAGVLERLRARL
jgi:phage shock protein A